MLEGDAGLAEVREQLAEASAMGISAVPTYVFDGRWTVPGAQDPDVFVNVLNRVRSLSAVHKDQPFVLHAGKQEYRVDYTPGESTTSMFGGNSNWRGPIWMPVNFLIIESLQKFHHYYGDEFKIECPTGSGIFMTINDVADELARRLTQIFLKDGNGKRPVLRAHEKTHSDPHFSDHVQFYEYFHGDNGRGVGASHQTGWTGLVAKLLQPRRGKTSDTMFVTRPTEEPEN